MRLFGGRPLAAHAQNTCRTDYCCLARSLGLIVDLISRLVRGVRSSRSISLPIRKAFAYDSMRITRLFTKV